MKKLFLISLAAIMVSAMVSSCTPDNPGPNKQKQETVVPDLEITIDGSFDDWKDIKGLVVSELPDDETAYPGLLKIMAAADKNNVYFYFEYQVVEDQTAAPFTLNLNSDDDSGTGLKTSYWMESGWDYTIESGSGFMTATGSYKKMNDLKLLKPNEGTDGQERSWDPKNTKELSAKGVKNQGSTQNDVLTFEMLVPRSLIDAEKKGTLWAGAYVENQSWNVVGIIPIEDGISQSEMLEIPLP